MDTSVHWTCSVQCLPSTMNINWGQLSVMNAFLACVLGLWARFPEFHLAVLQVVSMLSTQIMKVIIQVCLLLGFTVKVWRQPMQWKVNPDCITKGRGFLQECQSGKID